jgi:hypothetical protein
VSRQAERGSRCTHLRFAGCLLGLADYARGKRKLRFSHLSCCSLDDEGRRGRRGLPRPQRTCSWQWLQAALLLLHRRFRLRLSEQRKTLRLPPSGPTPGRFERKGSEIHSRPLPTVGLSLLSPLLQAGMAVNGTTSITEHFISST